MKTRKLTGSPIHKLLRCKDGKLVGELTESENIILGSDNPRSSAPAICEIVLSNLFLSITFVIWFH